MTSGARAITAGLSTAVAAARVADEAGFATAATTLMALDQPQLSLVQSTVIRQLLEELHPDGIDGDDAQQALQACVAAAGWYPELAPEVVAAVLLTALGAGSDDAPAIRAEVLNVHACLLIAYLLGRRAAPLTGYVDRAIAEIHRAQTMELP
jgi:hypothetical protein